MNSAFEIEKMPHVTFVHLDLGIGGAERLVVDAAMALKKSGHSVEFVTSHHDKTHCFPETRDELRVTVSMEAAKNGVHVYVIIT